MTRPPSLAPSDVPAVGVVVHYNSPDWGPSRGKVLDVPREIRGVWSVLCQDFHPIGGREYWPIAELTWKPPNVMSRTRPTREAVASEAERVAEVIYLDGASS